jgi:hypothetical protein
MKRERADQREQITRNRSAKARINANKPRSNEARTRG